MKNREYRAWELVAVTIALAAVAMARPPYIFLLGLVLLVDNRRARTLSYMLFGIFLVLGWTLIVSGLVGHSADADPQAQFRFIISHPFDATYAFLLAAINIPRESFVGVLGWLDVGLPTWYYITSYVFIILIVFVYFPRQLAAKFKFGIILIILSHFSIIAIQYMTWSKPGSSFVDGIQGRYYIPLAMSLTLILSRSPGKSNIIKTVALMDASGVDGHYSCSCYILFKGSLLCMIVDFP